MNREDKNKEIMKYEYPTRPALKNELRKNSIVELTTNLFEIQISKREQKMVFYSVSIEPPLDSNNSSLYSKIQKYIEPEKNKIFQKTYYSGYNLFANSNNPPNEISFSAIVENKEFTMKLKLICLLEMKEIVDLSGKNKMTKSFFEKLIKYILLMNKNTIKFGDRNTIVKINPNNFFQKNEKEALYKGFFTSGLITESGLFLLALNVNRYVLNITAHQQIEEIKQKYKDSQVARSEVEKFFKIHKTVLTTYGSLLRAYRVASIDFDANPKNISVNIIGKDKISTTTLLDYYKNQYNITIQDENQPLIIAENKAQRKGKKKDPNEKDNNSQNIQHENLIYLIPELLYITGNIQDIDNKKRRDKPNKIVSNPSIKMKEICAIKELMTSTSGKTYKTRDGKILPTKSPAQIAKEWGISLGNNLVVKGRILPPPTLLYGREKKVEPKNGRFRSEVAYKGIALNKKNFVYIYDENDNSNIKCILRQLFDKAKSKNIKIESGFSEINGIGLKGNANWENIYNSIKVIKQKATEIKMAIVFLSNRLEKYYSQLKTFFTNEAQFPTQFCLSKKLQDAKKAGSIMFNIVEQINAKMGGTNFYIDFYGSNILSKNLVYMIIGLESRMSSRGIDYVMTSSTSKHLEKVITSVESVQNNAEQREKAIFSLLELALLELQKGGSPHPPDYVILYRQGGNYVQNLKLAELEVPFFTGFLKNKFKNKCKFMYVCCNLKTELKFFQKNQNIYVNPNSGVCIDTTITQKDKYEFYLQPQFVNQGTATSCHYQVLYEDRDEINPNNNLKLEQVELLGYYLSYYYWTWAGAIRVPGVLKFATTAMDFFTRHLNGELKRDNKQFINPEYI